MKKLHLSVVTQVVNQEGEELLERASGKKEKTIGGLTREWFTEQNLTPPPELEEDEIEMDEEGAVYLDEKHLDYEAMSVTIPIKNIDSWVEDTKIGTMVYMKSGMFYHVYETTDEIDDYVDYLNSSWLDKRIARFQIKWFSSKRRFLNIFSREKDLKTEID